MAISVDPPAISHALCQKAGYTYPFLADPDAAVIRRYGLVHAGAGIHGQDIARPAEFLVDASGTVRWVHMTTNYWVRARPEQMLAVGEALSLAPQSPGPLAR